MRTLKEKRGEWAASALFWARYVLGCCAEAAFISACMIVVMLMLGVMPDLRDLAIIFCVAGWISTREPKGWRK